MSSSSDAGGSGETLLSGLARKLLEIQTHDRPFDYAPGEDAAALREMVRSFAGVGVPRNALARVGAAFQGEVLRAKGLEEIVVAGGETAKLIEGALGAFGHGVKVSTRVDIRDALSAAQASNKVLACLPWPEKPGIGQWWPVLNENRFRDLRIATGWPSLSGDGEIPEVAIVGLARLAPSGSDHMLAMAHDDRHVAERAFAAVGIEARATARARSQVLIRIQGFLTEDDHRLDAPRRAGLEGLRIIGALPLP